MDDIYQQWYENKKRFIDKFGGLIYEIPTPITFEINADLKSSKASCFAEVLDDIYGLTDLANYIWKEKENFFSNISKKDFTTESGIVIKAGSKIIKAFKHFINDKELLTELQNRASMIIQEDKITGTLCLSVHPLDFLSSSENTYNWRSCHALDGDFRTGNLSYMCDPSTIICYLKGADDVALPNFPKSVLWNSKKWRMLVHTDNRYNIFFAGRQYPFFSETALHQIRIILMDLFSNTILPYTGWGNEYLYSYQTGRYVGNITDYPLDDKYAIIHGHLYPMHKLIKDARHSRHYSDLLNSTCYIPYYMFTRECYDTELELNIGANVKCVCCNKNYNTSESFLCNSCAEEYVEEEDECVYCSICDRRIPIIESFYIPEEDQVLCAHCFDTVGDFCQRCHTWHRNGELTYSNALRQILCDSCLEEVEDISDGS